MWVWRKILGKFTSQDNCIQSSDTSERVVLDRRKRYDGPSCDLNHSKRQKC